MWALEWPPKMEVILSPDTFISKFSIVELKGQ